MEKRKRYIDIAKGIAMILVIMGHCKYVNQYLDIWIYSFHMPLFFILSGMTFSIKNKSNLKEFIKNKFFKLLIPYILLSISLWLTTDFIKIIIKGFDWIYIKEFLGIFISNRSTPYYFTMWFVLVLFEAETIIYIVISYLQKYSIKIRNIFFIVVFGIASLIGVVLSKNTTGFIFCLDLLPFGIAFVIFGYLIKENEEFFKNVFEKKYMIIFFGIANLVFTYLNYRICGRTDLYECNTGNYLYCISHSIFGSLLVINICYVLGKCKKIEYIGKNSLVFYAFQNSLVIPNVTKIFERIFYKIKLIHKDFIIYISVIIVSLLVLTIVNEIIRKYLPFLLGKREKA